MSVALVKIQIRNDTSQAWAVANPLLSDGEPGAESNTGRLKIGNGTARWLDLPYVGGTGGGEGTTPIAGIIDGGIFTGNPSVVDAGPPIQPVAAKANVDGVDTVVVSWAPAYVSDPDATILYYAVEFTTTPSESSTWAPCGQSNLGTEEVKLFARSSTPSANAATADYYYRVQAVLSTGGRAEWGYTPVYRHIKTYDPITFTLAVDPSTIGSTSSDNMATVSVVGLSGGGPTVSGPAWSYPAIEGLAFVETGSQLSIENTRGIDTVDQTIFIQCEYTSSVLNTDTGVTQDFSEVQTIQLAIQNTSPDPGPDPDPEPEPPTGNIFNWEIVNAEEIPPALANSNNFDGKPTGLWQEGYVSAYRGPLQACNTLAGQLCLLQNPFYEGPFDSSVDPGPEFRLIVTCDTEFTIPIVFDDFTLLLTAPNGSYGFSTTITRPPATQYKQVNLIGGAACTNEPIVMLPDLSLFEIQNPIFMKLGPFQGTDPITGGSVLKEQVYTSPYQVVSRCNLNGSVADYLLCTGEAEVSGFAEGGVPTFDQTNGFLLQTRDGGQTFKTVDVRGSGVTVLSPAFFTNPEYRYGPNDIPKMLFKTEKDGRDILVGLFDFVGGQIGPGEEASSQFYYTDDHITWYPASNIDRLPETVWRIWTDPETGHTYATDSTHTGILSEPDADNKQFCSYYRSVPTP